MRILLSGLLLLQIACLYGQQVDPERRAVMSPKQLATQNSFPRSRVLPANVLNNPAALKAFISQMPSERPAIINRSSRVAASNPCIDSSFVKLNGIVENAVYVNTITHTRDDGVLIAGLGFSTLPVFLGWQTYGLLCKVDNMGNILWKKMYKDEQDREKYDIETSVAKELNNGDILTVSSLDTAQGNTSQDMMHENMLITRHDAAGNVKWYKTYNSLLSVANQNIPFDVKTVTEAASGDLIFCGTTMTGNGISAHETVMRTDNAGSKIWDVNFLLIGDYNGVTEGMNAFIDNNKIIVSGIAHGVSGNYPLINSVHFLTLDYNTGNLLSKRSYTPDYYDNLLQYKNLTHYSNRCIRLDNGHYLLWGQTYSDFSQMFPTTDYFIIVEFDAGFNIVDAYTLSGELKHNYYVNYMYFDPTGRGLFQLSDGTLTFEGSLYNKQLRKERVKDYGTNFTGNNTSFGTNQLYCFFDDNSYLHGTSYFEDFLLANSYIQFRKLHDSDTSSLCLGYDSMTVRTLPFAIKEDPASPLQPTLNEQLFVTDIKVIYTDENGYRYKNPCDQKSYCDTLKIHGDSIVCNTQQPKVFSVYKNPLCGSFAEWQIDPTVISSLTILNDTSVSVVFRDVNWNGKIYASLSTGRCTVALLDSLPLHIVKAMAPIALGEDQDLCPGNSIALHAGPGFETYTWQDGSIDSLFTVTTTGEYYVKVKDYCGNTYSDTIVINPANHNFTLGADTVKCNNDQLVLTATPGFTNYQWLPAYNISSVSGNTAVVFPLTDTDYIVSAEKSAGCIVRDTIHVGVRLSPAINLGRDTSLCTGDQLVLQAGAGFSAYSWSTGGNGTSVIVKNAGSYSVKALFSNGCYSMDTMKVIAVNDLPVFSLGNNTDTILCAGKTLSYHFPISNAVYLWSDGSSSDSKIFSSPATIWLKITKEGCSYADTIRFGYKPAPVVHLGKDTMLCEGVTMQLDASYPSAGYLWQDGSINPIYSVKSQGIYSVKLSLNGCDASDTIAVDYKYKPSFAIGEDRFLCEGQQETLVPTGSGGSGYLWQDGSTNPYYIVSAPGLYILRQTNECGASSDSVKIDMGPCKFWLPSAFTPNGDGNNDLFRLRYPFPVKQYRLAVFNRWGQKVFETNDMVSGWDGTFKGILQPQDVYVWVATIVYPDDRKENAKGTITLIR